jgi:hypothetical protein
MAITYPISLPTSLGVRSITWRQRSVVALGRSPFTGQQQVYRHAGQWWEVSVTYPAVKNPAVAEAMVAALASLNGSEGTFMLGDSVQKVPRGTISGTVNVGAGATKDSTVLPLSGGSGVFAVGDWLQISTHLYKVLKVNSGNVDVWPRLRQAYSSGTAITYNNPKGVFRLTDGQSWDVNEAKVYGISFTAVEAI